MSRAGRKRKAEVPRRKGRIDWAAEREDPTLVAKWHRARDNILAFGGDPLLASQAGKLYVWRHLTAVEVEAVDRWRKLLSTYDRVVLGMARTVGGSWLDRIGASLVKERDQEWVRAFLDERFNPAQDAVLRAGKPALSALNRLCRDEASTSVLPDARKALVHLIKHFGLQSARSPLDVP